jgi:hypothetical protein
MKAEGDQGKLLILISSLKLLISLSVTHFVMVLDPSPPFALNRTKMADPHISFLPIIDWLPVISNI